MSDQNESDSPRFSVEALRQELLEIPRDELVDKAFDFQRAYRTLLNRGVLGGGRISAKFFDEVLEGAYPDADVKDRRLLAFNIQEMIYSEFGAPKSPVTREEAQVVSQKAEAAKDILAGSLTPEDVELLEATTRKRIAADKWPENFDEFKEQWLAEWIAKGILHLQA